MHRILGVDPGLGITGYAVVESDAGRDPRVIEAGAIRPGRGEDLAERLRRLHEDLSAVVAEFAPRRVAVEQVFVHRRHVRSAVQMGHARGVILLTAATAEIAVDEFSPAEIKKSLTGHGQASKRQMQTAVMRACGLARLPEPADVADAIAIALCGATRCDRPLETVATLALHAAEADSRPRRSRVDGESMRRSRNGRGAGEALAVLRLRGVEVSDAGE